MYLHTLISGNPNFLAYTTGKCEPACVSSVTIAAAIYSWITVLPNLSECFTADCSSKLNVFPSYFQVEVQWKEGNGLPPLSTNCIVDEVDAPPPLPISVVNIVNIDTGRVTLALSGDVQDVEATVM